MPYQSDHLDVALFELARHLGESPELRRTHGGEVGRVREENSPAVAEPLVEVDLALCGVGLKVRRCCV